MEDKIYRLKEMETAMEQSLENAQEIIAQQTLLIEVVENSDKKDKFEDFLKDSKEALETLKQKKDDLVKQKELFSRVIKKADESEEDKELINLMIEALGLFK